jgi:glycosyltransferase involved in cell wall biosynthesis
VSTVAADPMKLLYINTYDPGPEKHGGATVTRAEVAALRERFDVDVLFGSTMRTRAREVSYPRLFADLLRLRSVKYASYNVLRRTPDFYRRYDVIWCNHDFSAYDHRVFERLGIPFVVRKHNAEHRFYDGGGLFSRYERNRIFAFEREACGGALATFHISATEFAEDDYSRRKLFLPPLLGLELPGPDDGDAPYAFADRPIDLLCVSNFDWHPNREGIEWFIEHALALLDPGVSLHLVGVGSERYANGARVVGHGFAAELEPFYRGAKIFLSPILSGAGIKIKNVSALVAGMPLVSTSKGIEGIQGANESGAVKVGDTPAEFAACIAQLLRDESACRQMSRQSRHWVRSNMTTPQAWTASVERVLQEAKP